MRITSDLRVIRYCESLAVVTAPVRSRGVAFQHRGRRPISRVRLPSAIVVVVVVVLVLGARLVEVRVRMRDVAVRVLVVVLDVLVVVRAVRMRVA